MFGLKRYVICALAALVSVVSAAEWGTNYEAALAQARAEGKAVLADFTGSDWCGYCMLLRQNVLERPEFAAWAEQHFVLLEVDMPNNPTFSREQLAQNQMLCTKYAVGGFPTLLVIDAKGRALGGLFGYMGDAGAVRQKLERGLEAVRLLQVAEAMEGEAKARAMVDAWLLVPEDLYEVNRALQMDVAEVDTQDRSGLKAAAEAERRYLACKHAADAAPTDAAALDIVEAALFEAVPQNKRQLLELKYKLMICSVENEADVLRAAEVAYAIIDADLRVPEHEKASRKKQMQGVFANPRTSLNRSRMIKRRRPIR
ncbi:MAG: DUF255 domain-containing protein [Akkermansiaceae bacterium]|nr:DUF255 domain-containing protein [Akkermansiaceae bacterium]